MKNSFKPQTGNGRYRKEILIETAQPSSLGKAATVQTVWQAFRESGHRLVALGVNTSRQANGGKAFWFMQSHNSRAGEIVVPGGRLPNDPSRLKALVRDATFGL